jgi:hypothetical protein
MALKSGWHGFRSEGKNSFLNYGIKRDNIWSGSEDYYKNFRTRKKVLMNEDSLNAAVTYRLRV